MKYLLFCHQSFITTNFERKRIKKHNCTKLILQIQGAGGSRGENMNMAKQKVIFNIWHCRMSHLVEAWSSKVTLCLPLNLRLSQFNWSEVSGDVLGEGDLGRSQQTCSSLSSEVRTCPLPARKSSWMSIGETQSSILQHSCMNSFVCNENS